MNLCVLNDQELIVKTKTILADERRARVEFICHLGEIHRRKLFALRGYRSLFEMCVKEFGLSEASAYRRVAAVRLLLEAPEIEAKISSGALTLTAVSQVYGAVRKLRKNQKKISLQAPLAQKQTQALTRSLLQDFENTTNKQRQERLAEVFPDHAPHPELMRPLNEHRVELRLTVTKELAQKIEHLKNLMSHQNPEMSLEGLLACLVEFGLKKSDPLYKRAA